MNISADVARLRQNQRCFETSSLQPGADDDQLLRALTTDHSTGTLVGTYLLCTYVRRQVPGISTANSTALQSWYTS